VDLPPLYYTTIEVEALNVKYIILIKKWKINNYTKHTSNQWLYKHITLESKYLTHLMAALFIKMILYLLANLMFFWYLAPIISFYIAQHK
jgi:hypothetical protein